MSKLPRLSGKDTIKILEHFGFEITNWKGSHVTMVNRNRQRTPIAVIVPAHQELKQGTLSHIVNESGVGRQEFLKLAAPKQIAI